jgi:hypothetical protein
MTQKEQIKAGLLIPKILHFPKDVIKKINLKAVKSDTDFKNYVQELVEKEVGK